MSPDTRRTRGVALLALCASLAGCENPFAGSEAARASPQLHEYYFVRNDIQPGILKVAFDGARLYANTLGEIVAFDATTGEVAWRTSTPPDESAGVPAVGDGWVVAASSRFVRGYDPATGAVRWTQTLGQSAVRHTPDIADGVFYVGTDTVIYALDVATGAIRWSTVVGSGWEHAGRVQGVRAHGDALYACVRHPLEWNGWRTQGHVLALDRATGAIRWRYVMVTPMEYSFCVMEPVVDGDAVLLSDTGANGVVALDRLTGAFRWRYNGDPGWFGSSAPPVVFGDTVVVASGDTYVTALHRSSGAVLWRTPVQGSAFHANVCGRYVLVNRLSLMALDRRGGRVAFDDVVRERDDFTRSVMTRPIVRGDTAWLVGERYTAKFRCPG